MPNLIRLGAYRALGRHVHHDCDEPDHCYLQLNACFAQPEAKIIVKLLSARSANERQGQGTGLIPIKAVFVRNSIADFFDFDK